MPLTKIKSENIDSSGNLNIDTGTLFIDSTNDRVGIGNTAPTHKLRVEGSSSLAGAVTDITTLAAGNTTISGNLQVGSSSTSNSKLSIGVSPTAFSTVKANIAISVDSNYHNHESYLYIQNTALTAARSYNGIYTFNINQSQHKSSDGLTSYGSDAYGTSSYMYNGDNNTGGDARIDTTWGVLGEVRNYANGASSNSITNGHGLYGIVRTWNSGTITTAYGVRILVSPANSTITGNITTAFGVHSTVGVTGGGPAQIANGFLYYGAYPATANVVSGRRWGIYLENEDNSYFSGNVGIGNTAPTHKLRVEGTTSLAGAVSGITTLAAGNTTVTGFVNSTSNINAASFNVGATQFANTSGVYATFLDNIAAANYARTDIADTFAGALTITAGANSVQFTNATSNWIYWNTAGVQAPNTNARSAGTKLLLYPSASNVDYAIGIESGHMWYSIPSTATGFKWYSGATNYMTSTTAGLDVTGSVTSDTLRLNSTTDASLTSTGHAFQIGPTTAGNVIIDNNEIMARNNGSASLLQLNGDGGNITLGDATTTVNIFGNVNGATITTSSTITAAAAITTQGNMFAGDATTSTGTRQITIGGSRTGSGISTLDLVGDTTYTNYGARFLRYGGANANTLLSHKGTGSLDIQSEEAGTIRFLTSATERGRISAAAFYWGTTAANPATSSVTTDAGVVIDGSGRINMLRDNGFALGVNRTTSDGPLIQFYKTGSAVGDIRVDAGTISVTAFLGAHWSTFNNRERFDVLPGTILDTIDGLVEWKVIRFEVSSKTITIPYEGIDPVGTIIDYEYEGTVYSAEVQLETPDEELNKHVKVKISDTVGSKAVYGVFLQWNNEENDWNTDFNVASVGNYFIRISGDYEVEIGDLIESNGDGTGKPQDDDIIRSKTVGKITSTIKQKVYDDGSYLVTAVLYCG